MHLRVRKKNGKTQPFEKEKIFRAARKSGASIRNANRTANAVASTARIVSWRKLRELVISELRRLDRKSANSFKKFRKKK